MKQLSVIDNLFLLMEQRQQPLHVGALCLYQPPADAPPDFALRLADHLRESTEAARPFNRRLVSRAGFKFWEEDGQFDIAHHFVHLALPKPGRIRELLAMVSRVHSAHLDRAYPLWRTYLIEGLEDGRIATYSKIHHSLVDGVAGIRLMLKSMSPDVAESLTMPAPWEVRTRKSRERTLPVPAGALRGFAALRALGQEGATVVPPVLRQLRRAWQDLRDHNPDFVGSLQAPHCILNEPITGSRRFAAQSYSMPRIKAIARKFDATANDVILALCGGALRQYLGDMNALPEKPLVAAVPVSTRRDDSDSGNEIAFALTHLATHLDSPIERLQAIKRCMDYNKAFMRQLSPAQLLAYEAVMLAPGALNLLTGFDRRRTLLNLVISHVPGPRQEMYWQGARLDGVYPVSLVIDKMALNITLISRHDKVDFGIIACRKTLPSVQRLLEHIEEALDELETACA
ncbi:wax ester/triacylglycerol synthase family O-acyltransferase [Flagellatimonas centrodinii]|uniref:WS/DGAT/MGAT family O-acyltransferase n=1 Tax=Flagellatimonas centrodinii TaxID=2806210 RepID=UPI001FEF59F0|nr:wax ester/triacylglycerol synthase family O-acyltransferase [Flagellatimonas centrodinii]ULQ47988.1 wax ester/triacylglycerol synthase family O-acyltransferase [Flagellatimonas centrodinii]